MYGLFQTFNEFRNKTSLRYEISREAEMGRQVICGCVTENISRNVVISKVLDK